MVVVRRTFHGKPGHSGPVVALCKELVRVIKEVDETQGAQRV